ncbi:MAG TPA: GMP/IMP nucleotidase [Povalibacter sp.]
MNTALVSLTSGTGPDWQQIDTVLLDMDGTLLDLRFDNDFWLKLIPERFALRHSLTPEAALLELTPRFAAVQGTLDWYCTDYWSRELGLDIAGLKHEVREQVAFLPGAQAFLLELRRRQLRTVLLTNAHRDSLNIKAAQTQLTQYFDAVVSSHQYGAPKESEEFWRRAQTALDFDPARSLFVDDSLAVLRAAREFGVAQIYAITHPDSGAEVRIVTEFPAVRAACDLISA